MRIGKAFNHIWTVVRVMLLLLVVTIADVIDFIIELSGRFYRTGSFKNDEHRAGVYGGLCGGWTLYWFDNFNLQDLKGDIRIFWQRLKTFDFCLDVQMVESFGAVATRLSLIALQLILLVRLCRLHPEILADTPVMLLVTLGMALLLGMFAMLFISVRFVSREHVQWEKKNEEDGVGDEF